MGPSHSTSRRERGLGRRRRPRRRIAAVAVVAAVGVLVVPVASRAAPAQAPSAPVAPQLPTNPESELAELEARAAKLSKQYRGELVNLEEAKKGAEQSASRLKKVEDKLEKARERVAHLAASQYMGGGLDPAFVPLITGNPDVVLDKAVTAQHLARSGRNRLVELVALQERYENSQKSTQARLDEVREEVEALEKERHKVEKLMDKFLPQAPIIGDSVTPRMRHVRTLAIERFGAPYAVGCYRPGSWGEHPLGQACDFMLSSGGAMPSAVQVERGWAIANWATANASDLGIMYVIYRQQIWDIRSGGGWDPMEDRGSITANHYDHVHISVF